MNPIELASILRKQLQSAFSRPLNTDTRAGRNWRAVVNGLGAALARASQVGVALFTMPMAIKYLGQERFGLWITIQSVMTMAAFSDFGLGNGILNSIAAAYGRDDNKAIRRIISSGLAVLTAIAATLFTLFLSAYSFISWADVFRVTSPLARAEAAPVLLIFAVCFVLNIPLGVIQRVQLGLQEAYLTSVWQFGGSALALFGVIAGIHMHASLRFLVAAVAGGPVLANALNTLYFFLIRRPDLRFSMRLVSRQEITQIARLGGLFFVLQVVVAFAYCADNLIIARTLGAVNVPEYSVPQRIFQIVSLGVSMLLSPLWPAYGEAISRGDAGWVKRTLSRTLQVVFASTLLLVGLILLLSNRIIGWWIGPGIHPPFALLLGLAFWTVIDCCGNTVAMFLNGASVMRFQIIFASLFGVGCLSAKVILTRYYGIAAVPWATSGTYILLSAIPCAVYVPRLLERMKIATQLRSTPSLAYQSSED